MTFDAFIVLNAEVKRVCRVLFIRMRKKKRSRSSKKGTGNPSQPQSNIIEGEEKVIGGLVTAFGSVSFSEAAAAYKEAEGDANKAAEILGNSFIVEESGAEDQSTTCSSSSGIWSSSSRSSVATTSTSSSSSSSEVFSEPNVGRSGVRNQKARAKKVVAVAGTVSTMLGKDYVRSVQKRTSLKSKGFGEGSWSKAEQFLWSVLGEDSELSMDVVSDVLCEL